MPSATPSVTFAAPSSPDDRGARGQPVGGACDGRDGAREPRPRIGQTQQRRCGEHGVDEEQHPRAPRHGRAGLERDVDAPHVELVREIEEQGEHAERQQHDREDRRLHRVEALRVVAAREPEQVDAGQHHHAGDDAAQEQVDRDLPAPDGEMGIDQGIVAGGGDLEHGRDPLREVEHARTRAGFGQQRVPLAGAQQLADPALRVVEIAEVHAARRADRHAGRILAVAGAVVQNVHLST